METTLEVGGIDFDAGHFIPWHPKCGRVHGHTYDVRVVLSGTIDPVTQMILDFGLVKTAVKATAEWFDHKIIVAFPRVHGPMNTPEGKRWDISLDRGRTMFLDEDEVVIIDADPTVENIATEFARRLALALRNYSNLTSMRVYISEGNAKGAEVSTSLPIT